MIVDVFCVAHATRLIRARTRKEREVEEGLLLDMVEPKHKD
jgi:hypothetical protein